MTVKGGTTPACAACKYQRRKCSPTCPLAPYFPANQTKMFQNVHRLFGVSNVTKTLERLHAKNDKDDAMKSLIYEAEMRQKFPVHGCCAIIRHLNQQIHFASEELQQVHLQLQAFRAQYMDRQSGQLQSEELQHVQVSTREQCMDRQIEQSQPEEFQHVYSEVSTCDEELNRKMDCWGPFEIGSSSGPQFLVDNDDSNTVISAQYPEAKSVLSLDRGNPDPNKDNMSMTLQNMSTPIEEEMDAYGFEETICDFEETICGDNYMTSCESDLEDAGQVKDANYVKETGQVLSRRDLRRTLTVAVDGFRRELTTAGAGFKLTTVN